MKKLISLLFVALFIFSCKTEPKPKEPTVGDTQLVKECFQKYKNALLEGSGVKVMEQVSKKTLDYYSEMLRYAKGADSTAIAKSALTEKFTILQTRQRIDNETLVKMSNESYFTYVVEQGMIGKSSVDGVEMGDVFVEGNTANGAIIIKGVAQKYQFNFIKEKEGWKMDLFNLMMISSDGLKAEIANSPLSENEYISKLLEVITRKARKKDLWQPRLK